MRARRKGAGIAAGRTAAGALLGACLIVMSLGAAQAPQAAVTATPQAGVTVTPPAGPDVLQTAAPTPQYTGERVTMNFKDADLADFFRLIHEISGLNIVVDPNVKGTVTLALEDVPWDQALDIVLRNNGLGKEVEGNVVRIATLKTLDEEAGQVATLRRTEEESSPLVTAYRTLSYAKATDVAALLNNSRPTTAGAASASAGAGAGGEGDNGAAVAGYGLLCARCQVTADARTNTLIVQAPSDYLPKLDAVLAKLDRKTPQVEVEARVVSTTESFSRELGVQLGIGAGNSTSAVYGAPQLGYTSTQANGVGTSALYPINSSNEIPFAVNLPAGAPTSGLGFINATNSYRIDAVLTAAESHGQGKVLSRPEVITQNNTAALVQQGVKIPVQTNINNTISVQFFNVVLSLQVTPQITADGNIFLTVNITNDQIDPGIPYIQGIPAIDTQQTTTNVLVANGSTVVIGGVMINNTQNTIDSVPLLGDMPLLGYMFKHTLRTSSSQELMFFLTPKILPS